jgi:hypothetical protein
MGCGVSSLSIPSVSATLVLGVDGLSRLLPVDPGTSLQLELLAGQERRLSRPIPLNDTTEQLRVTFEQVPIGEIQLRCLTFVGDQVRFTGSFFRFNLTQQTRVEIDCQVGIRIPSPTPLPSPSLLPSPSPLPSESPTVPTAIIETFEPRSGFVGSPFVIRGQAFSEPLSILLGSTPITNFVLVSPSEIRAIVPKGSITGAITLRTPAGEMTTVDTFRVIGSPTIESFAPSQGPVGASVTVSGSNFVAVNQVTLNGIPILDFEVVSESTLQFIVPEGAETGPIGVTTPGGETTTLNVFRVQESRLLVTVARDARDSNPGDGICEIIGGGCTLRAAIQEANLLPGEQTIRFAPSPFFLPVIYSLLLAGSGEDQAATGDLDITDSLTIIGNGPDETLLVGAGLDRILHILPGETSKRVTLKDLRLTTGLEDGAGIRQEATNSQLFLNDVDLVANVGLTIGGGLWNEGGRLVIERSRIESNTVLSLLGQGAGIAHTGGELRVSNTRILNNQAILDQNLGGGLFLDGSAEALIEDSQFIDNEATQGGGIFIRSTGTTTLVNVQLQGNKALLFGGGLSVNRLLPGSSRVVIEGGRITNNTAGITGGGIFAGIGSVISPKNIPLTEDTLFEGITFEGNLPNNINGIPE